MHKNKNIKYLINFFIHLDLVKLYQSQYMDPTNGPRPLQNKVMFDIRFFFACRGSENFKDMKQNMFKIIFDQKIDLIYIKKDKDELTKNHKECTNEIITGYMPELKGHKLCPVDSFREYFSHLNPNNEALWQTPIKKPKTSVWYADSPVGKHTLADFMKNLSTKAALSKIYTNHDIRVTGCSVLALTKFSDKQIMSVSGHKSCESLKIYKKVSSDEKVMMGYTLGYALNQPQDIPIGPIQKHFITPPQPQPKKLRAIMTKENEPEEHLPKRSKLSESTVVPIAQPSNVPDNTSNPTVPIPD